MPTARFEMGGKKYRVEVSDTFKDLSKKEMFTLTQSGGIQRVLFHLLEELLK